MFWVYNVMTCLTKLNHFAENWVTTAILQKMPLFWFWGTQKLSGGPVTPGLRMTPSKEGRKRSLVIVRHSRRQTEETNNHLGNLYPHCRWFSPGDEQRGWTTTRETHITGDSPRVNGYNEPSTTKCSVCFASTSFVCSYDPSRALYNEPSKDYETARES